MRILHVADVQPAPDSGAAGTDFETVGALRRAGHDVEAVWADELSHRIGHYNLRYLMELPGAYRTAVRNRLRGRTFDVVQVSQPHGYLAAQFVAAAPGGPVFVHRSHGFEPRARDELARWRVAYPEHRPRAKQIASALMQRALERNNREITTHADGHLVSATECAEYLATRYGVDAGRIAVIPQGVAPEFTGRPVPTDPLRFERLLYVGQYGFAKAPMVLGEAVTRLLALHPNLSFTWVCDRRHHANAASHIGAGVRHQVRFLDWMPQSRLIDVYDHHGIFLFPSFFEGFGKVFLEAMSRGLVVVAADNGGARDLITDRVDGYKVRTGSAAALIEAADRVLARPDLAREIAASAAGRAAVFTWDRHAEASTRFYERLVALGRVKPAWGN